MTSTATVLTTVNAPYSEHLDAAALAHCLKDTSAAKAKPGHMSSFFAEVAPEAQKAFAESMGIDKQTLATSAQSFAAYSGEHYPLAG